MTLNLLLNNFLWTIVQCQSVNYRDLQDSDSNADRNFHKVSLLSLIIIFASIIEKLSRDGHLDFDQNSIDVINAYMRNMRRPETQFSRLVGKLTITGFLYRGRVVFTFIGSPILVRLRVCETRQCFAPIFFIDPNVGLCI